MGVNRFFWPQELLDQWIVEEKITLDGQKLTLIDENRIYDVQQAIYFTSDVGDGKDHYKLIGRVKEKSTLESMNGEHYMDSVLIEDSAYQVVPGFTGEPVQDVETQDRSREKAADLSEAIAGQTGEEDSVDDRELLAQFLIDNL